MSSIEPFVVSSRIRLISEYLEILRDFESMELSEYLANVRHQLLAERLLEILIQAAIDINRHILKSEQSLETLKNEETFLQMGNSGSYSYEVRCWSASILLAIVKSEQDVCAYAHATRTHSFKCLYLMSSGTAIAAFQGKEETTGFCLDVLQRQGRCCAETRFFVPGIKSLAGSVRRAAEYRVLDSVDRWHGFLP